MTTYRTGNAIGSADPRDLYDNAQNLDEAVNSIEPTFKDRLGNTRMTFVGMANEAGDSSVSLKAAADALRDADRAESQADRAEQEVAAGINLGVSQVTSFATQEADRAEAASDAAFVNADVYPDVATGRAAVANGEQFQVVEGDEIVRYRRNSSSSHTEVARYPSSLGAYGGQSDIIAADIDGEVNANLLPPGYARCTDLPRVNTGAATLVTYRGKRCVRMLADRDNQGSYNARVSWDIPVDMIPDGEKFSASVIIEYSEPGSGANAYAEVLGVSATHVPATETAQRVQVTETGEAIAAPRVITISGVDKPVSETTTIAYVSLTLSLSAAASVSQSRVSYVHSPCISLGEVRGVRPRSPSYAADGDILPSRTPGLTRTRNLFDKDDVYQGKAFSQFGALVDDPDRVASRRFIPVDSSRPIRVRGISIAVTLYDRNYQIVDRRSLSSNISEPILLDPDTEFIRASVLAERAEDVGLYYDDEFEGWYEPHGFIQSAPLVKSERLTGGAFAFNPEFPLGYYRPTETLPFSELSLSTQPEMTEALYARWQTLIDNHPEYITKEVLGPDSSGDYEVWRLKLSMPQPELGYTIRKPVPKILLFPNLHGYERMAPYDTLMFVQDLCENWTSNPLLAWMRWNVELVIIPTSNPWGFQQNQRKNANGVDLNRNFPTFFTPGTDPSDSLYPGEEPLSEPESQYLDQTIAAHSDALLVVDHHNMFSNSIHTWLSLNTGPGFDAFIGMVSRQVIQEAQREAITSYGVTNYGYDASDTNPNYGTFLKTHAQKVYGVFGLTYETSQAYDPSEALEDDATRIKMMTGNLGNFLITFLRAYAFYKY